MKSVHPIHVITEQCLSYRQTMQARNQRQEPSHKELLLRAKQRQRDNLGISDNLSEQLAGSVKAVVKINSSHNQSCLPLIDKIVTVHELSNEIDRQLNNDIAVSYDQFLRAKKKLGRCVTMSQRRLTMNPERNESSVDLLQRKLEIIDQEIRILEDTYKLVDEHRN